MNSNRSITETRRAAGSRLRAFTLIELMLGIAIMAIVMIAINAVLFASLRLRESTANMVEESLPVQQSLAILRRDLQGAMPPSDSGILSGSFKAGNVTSLGTSLPVSLELYTTTGVLREDEPWGEVQKVAYGLRPAGDRNTPGFDLYRSITRNLLATVTPQPEEQWMMNGVESLQFSCYDGSAWRDDWDTSLTDTNLPTAVRIRIVLAGNNGTVSGGRPIEMVVPIDSQSRSNQTTTAE
ncbi:MAG: GspJ family type II secretion system protein [Verrucomicrobiota bacterium]